MVKKCIVERENKRYNLFLKYYFKYKKLKDFIKSKGIYLPNDHKAYVEFQNIPRNANPTRKRNRCFISGRGRGYYRFFGLSRSFIRDLSFKGRIPGILKSS